MDSPLPHSCGQFPTHSVSLSLSVSLTPCPLEKLKELSRGYLEVVKTLFDRRSPPPEGKAVEELTRT